MIQNQEKKPIRILTSMIMFLLGYVFLNSATNLNKRQYVTFLIAIMLLIFLHIIEKDFSDKVVMENFAWFLFVIIMIISLGINKWPYKAIVATIMFSLGLTIKWFLEHKKNIYWIDCFFKMMFYISIFNLCFTMYTYFFGIAIYEKLGFLYSKADMERIIQAFQRNAYSGFIGEVAFSAFLSITGFIISLVKMGHSETKLNFSLNFLLSIIFAFSIFITQKRSFLLLLVLLVLFVGAVKAIKNESFFSFVWFSIIAIVVILVLFLILRKNEASRDILQTLVDRFKNEDGSMSGRDSLYQIARNIFYKNPIWGIGLGMYPEYIVSNNLRSEPIDAHNIYYKVLSELGIMAFIIFILILITNFRRALLVYKEACRRNEKTWEQYSLISLCFQLMYIVYGYTGSNFTHIEQVLMYFIMCGIINSLWLNSIESSSQMKYVETE